MHQHDFKVQTSWQGGRNNVGNVQGDILSENISIPASLGGVGIGTNPDEMLVSMLHHVISSHYLTTLERAKFTDISIEQQSIGTACLNNGKFSMSKIVHHPHIEIPSDQIAQLEKRLPKLITIADNNCMISNAVRDNVDIKIYPIIQAK